MINVLLSIIAVIGLGMAQVSFLTTWPRPVSTLNIVLSLAIFLAIIIDYKKALWFAFGAGLFLELFSSQVFGVVVLTLTFTVIAVNFLFTNFFTNRSFYSLMILGFIATVIYNLIKTIFTLFIALTTTEDLFLNFSFWAEYFWQPIFNLIVLGIIFVTYYFSTGRLKNIFLLPTN